MTRTPRRSRIDAGPLLPAVLIALVLATPAQGAVSVSSFSMTPSTTKTGGHPDLKVSVSFNPPTADIKAIALHLPGGLSANARAAPFCSRRYLEDDQCPLGTTEGDVGTKVGEVRLVSAALGLEAEVATNIYNLKPRGPERLRLGVPVFGSVSPGGAPLVLPVRERPEDHGLDVAVAGLPREVAGYSVGIKEVILSLKGTVRARIRGRLRRRALLTNPASCGQASTALDIVAYEGPPPTLTKVSNFTLAGCRGE